MLNERFQVLSVFFLPIMRYVNSTATLILHSPSFETADKTIRAMMLSSSLCGNRVGERCLPPRLATHVIRRDSD